MTEKFCVRCALETIYTSIVSPMEAKYFEDIKYKKVELKLVWSPPDSNLIKSNLEGVYQCPQCHLRYEFGIPEPIECHTHDSGDYSCTAGTCKNNPKCDICGRPVNPSEGMMRAHKVYCKPQEEKK